MDAGILPLVVVLLVIAGSYAVKGLIERTREASYQQYCETRGFHYEAKRPGGRGTIRYRGENLHAGLQASLAQRDLRPVRRQPIRRV